MSPYSLLTADQRDQLKRERVLALEADHQYVDLLLAEETDSAERIKLGEKLADLERRIRVHTDPPILGEPSETAVE